MTTYPAEPNTWQLWFDGSALPNPGRIGIGVLILAPDGRRLEHASAPNLHGCNNQAELHALITGLEIAHHSGACRLLVYGDSDVAISYVKGTSSTQIASLTPLIEQARGLLACFEHAELRWLPRHRNTEADRLCRLALGLAQKSEKKISMKKRR